MIILGIETSCDETAASIVLNGTTILSSIVSSQVAVHHPYGGVVPELASRKHIEAIVPVVKEAIKAAGISENKIDGIAVTQGPGLVGALLVGFCFARAYAFARNLPWIGVNHLQGHINSVFLTSDPPPFPFVSLLASGGHTGIYYVTSHTAFECMGQTRDDAAGEAYDKVAKMLGLGYPGGPIIDRLARKGDPGKIGFPRALLEAYDFSFSGLKTAVSRYIQEHKDDIQSTLTDIVAGFQASVVEVLTQKIIQAAVEKKSDHMAIVGGVAANKTLRETIRKDARSRGIAVHIPPVDLCGDNGAMIAATGYHYLKNGIKADLADDVYSRSR